MSVQYYIVLDMEITEWTFVLRKFIRYGITVPSKKTIFQKKFQELPRVRMPFLAFKRCVSDFFTQDRVTFELPETLFDFSKISGFHRFIDVGSRTDVTKSDGKSALSALTG